MGTTDLEHQAFVDAIHDARFKPKLRELTPIFRANLISEIPKWRNKGDIKGAQLLKWIYDQTAYQYYLVTFHDKGVFSLYPHSLKSTIVFGFMWANDLTRPHLRGYDENIEITGLHSIRKGEAYKLMRKLIDIAKQISVPILLWCETTQLKDYYERYGFTSCGRLGHDNEYLMVLFP